MQLHSSETISSCLIALGIRLLSDLFVFVWPVNNVCVSGACSFRAQAGRRERFDCKMRADAFFTVWKENKKILRKEARHYN